MAQPLSHIAIPSSDSGCLAVGRSPLLLLFVLTGRQVVSHSLLSAGDTFCVICPSSSSSRATSHPTVLILLSPTPFLYSYTLLSHLSAYQKHKDRARALPTHTTPVRFASSCNHAFRLSTRPSLGRQARQKKHERSDQHGTGYGRCPPK